MYLDKRVVSSAALKEVNAEFLGAPDGLVTASFVGRSNRHPNALTVVALRARRDVLLVQ